MSNLSKEVKDSSGLGMICQTKITVDVFSDTRLFTSIKGNEGGKSTFLCELVEIAGIKE